jgi:hypothetical protein
MCGGGIMDRHIERPMCLNVRSGDCAVIAEREWLDVRYRGEEYHVIGLFFRRLLNGRRKLCYILRAIDDCERPLAIF